ERSPFARTEIDEGVVLKPNRQAFDDGEKSFRLDPRVIAPVNPIGTGNLEIAQVSPAAHLAIRIHAIFAVEFAVFRLALQPLGGHELTQKVIGKQRAAQKCREYSAFRERFPESRHHSLHQFGHRVRRLSRPIVSPMASVSTRAYAAA